MIVFLCFMVFAAIAYVVGKHYECKQIRHELTKASEAKRIG